MANDAAWQAGVDIAQGKKKKQTKIGSDKDTSDGKNKVGGLLGYMGKKIGKLHSGGTVKKTGNYRLRKGERVLTVAQQKSAGLKKVGKKNTHARKRVAGKR